MVICAIMKCVRYGSIGTMMMMGLSFGFCFSFCMEERENVERESCENLKVVTGLYMMVIFEFRGFVLYGVVRCVVEVVM